ncbi:hypothetical protein UY3_18851 [Chelonia mydas]|uniref:Uncharacterized protein n=1 Tax=Chelonia mydas TaxID=8469 RepID=M7AIM8_CHEMY|nr:hypothetical protein UY3_18851 [Chelonia mydas]
MYRYGSYGLEIGSSQTLGLDPVLMGSPGMVLDLLGPRAEASAPPLGAEAKARGLQAPCLALKPLGFGFATHPTPRTVQQQLAAINSGTSDVANISEAEQALAKEKDLQNIPCTAQSYVDQP